MGETQSKLLELGPFNKRNKRPQPKLLDDKVDFSDPGIGNHVYIHIWVYKKMFTQAITFY